VTCLLSCRTISQLTNGEEGPQSAPPFRAPSDLRSTSCRKSPIPNLYEAELFAGRVWTAGVSPERRRLHGCKAPAMTMQEQYDLFGELVSKITDPIVGLQVKLQSPCCCHCDIARGVKGEWLNVPFCCEGSGIERDVDELMAGWVRWWDGKPTDHVMVRVADHIPPKKWIELGDSDEQQWETDLNGKRRDPWQFTTTYR
jgi:hypothetical protein